MQLHSQSYSTANRYTTGFLCSRFNEPLYNYFIHKSICLTKKKKNSLKLIGKETAGLSRCLCHLFSIKLQNMNPVCRQAKNESDCGYPLCTYDEPITAGCTFPMNASLQVCWFLQLLLLPNFLDKSKSLRGYVRCSADTRRLLSCPSPSC